MWKVSGKIEDEARLQGINNFLKTNVIESTKIMMFDAGLRLNITIMEK